MSYQINYSKQFVRLFGDRIIPMILDGSNNCTFVHRGREIRERDWNCRDYYFRILNQGRFFAESKVLENSVNTFIEKVVSDALKSGFREEHETREYILQRFGYFSSESFSGSPDKLTAKMYLNFFKTGIKNAKTIEELHSMGIHLLFTYFRWHTYQYSIQPPESKMVTTETEFYEELNKWEEFEKNCIVSEETKEGIKTFHPSIYLKFNEDWEYILNQIKRSRTKREREIKYEKLLFYYVLKNEKGYFVKKTKYGYQYITELNYLAKKFRTEKDALRYKKTIRSDSESFQVIKIERETEIQTIKYVA